jgi:hypothetical protein
MLSNSFMKLCMGRSFVLKSESAAADGYGSGLAPIGGPCRSQTHTHTFLKFAERFITPALVNVMEGL